MGRGKVDNKNEEKLLQKLFKFKNYVMKFFH